MEMEIRRIPKYRHLSVMQTKNRNTQSDLFTGWELYSEKCRREFEIYMKRKQEMTAVTTGVSDEPGTAAKENDASRANRIAPPANGTERARKTERYEYKFIVTTCDRNSLRSKYDRPQAAKKPIRENVAAVVHCSTRFDFTTAAYHRDTAAHVANGQTATRQRSESEPRLSDKPQIPAVHRYHRPMVVESRRREPSTEPTFRRGIVSNFGSYQRSSQPDEWQPINVVNREFVRNVPIKLSKKQKRLQIQQLERKFADPSDWDEYLRINVGTKTELINAIDEYTTSNSVDPLVIVTAESDYTTNASFSTIEPLTTKSEADEEGTELDTMLSAAPLSYVSSTASLNTLAPLVEETSAMVSVDGCDDEEGSIPFTDSTDDEVGQDETGKSSYERDEEEDALESDDEVGSAEGAFLNDYDEAFDRNDTMLALDDEVTAPPTGFPIAKQDIDEAATVETTTEPKTESAEVDNEEVVVRGGAADSDSLQVMVGSENGDAPISVDPEDVVGDDSNETVAVPLDFGAVYFVSSFDVASDRDSVRPLIGSVDGNPNNDDNDSENCGGDEYESGVLGYKDSEPADSIRIFSESDFDVDSIYATPVRYADEVGTPV